MENFHPDDPIEMLENVYTNMKKYLLVSRKRSLREISMIMGANRSNFVLVLDGNDNFQFIFTAVDLANSIGLGRELSDKLCDLNGSYEARFLSKRVTGSEALSLFESSGADVLPIIEHRKVIGYLKHQTITEKLTQTNTANLVQNKNSIFSPENMTSSLVHDVRTPLMVIEGTCRIVKMMASEDSKMVKRVEMIESANRKITDYINDILQASKLNQNPTVNLKPQSVTKLAKSSIDLVLPLSEARGQHISFDGGVEIKANIDGHLIERCLTNLLSNAIKYSGKDSKIELKLQSVPCLTGNLLNSLRISVSDSGPGISRDLRDSVFEKFFQKDSNPELHVGVGLGLHIANEFAKAHGGSLSLGDESEAGCKFSLFIPNCLIQIEKCKTPKNLLIVEDDIDLQEYISGLLSQEGYSVEVASCGVEALNKIQKENFDLVLSDINLPNLDGIDLIIGARKTEEELPFILMTGFLHSYAERIDGAKLDLYSAIEKPVNFKSLLGAVASHF